MSAALRFIIIVIIALYDWCLISRADADKEKCFRPLHIHNTIHHFFFGSRKMHLNVNSIVQANKRSTINNRWSK